MRISATTLESFRLYVQQDWMTEAALIESIKGAFSPTPQVLLGRAFGRVLERPDRFKVQGGYLCDGYSFSDETMREPMVTLDYTHGVFEAKAVKSYGAHEVVSKADYLHGASLHEFKTTESSFDFDKYESSCQWRFMADAFEPRSITYHIFRLDNHGNGVAEVKGVERFRLYPYADLHRDCLSLVRDFDAYVTSRGLADLLNERQKAAA